MDVKDTKCALCQEKRRVCVVEDGEGPAFCPTVNQKDLLEDSLREYSKDGVNRFALMASIQEGECYIDRHMKPYVLHPVKTRVEEICEFSHKMGYRRIGIAFCAGLRLEAQALDRILRSRGFEVVSVVCKVGATPKEHIGIKEEQKVRIGEFESMCSPIAQAAILNEAQTDFNVLVGLCVGHDSLFLKYSRALCTVLVAKDRVTGHSPAVPLYTLHSYYAHLLGRD